MKKIILVAAMLAASTAFADTTAGSTSGSVASVAPTNIGNPTINMPGTNPNTYTRFDGSTNQAATGPSVFVNAPAADTCERAGFGASVGTVGANAGVNIPRGQSDKCDVRADTVNLRFTGASQGVIKARHCMDAQMAEAYARAGEPCVDARPSRPVALLP
jgi:hypothetical protein